VPASPSLLCRLGRCAAAIVALSAAAARAQVAAAAPQPFPLVAYASFGSTMAQGGRFAEVGWTQPQFDAFLGGMRAAFIGKPFAVDESTHRLSADMSRRLTEIDGGNKAAQAAGEFPMAAYAGFGSSMGEDGHFSELGWTQEQFNAFADGMRAAFQGKPDQDDDGARRLSEDVSRRIADIEAAAKTRASEPFDPGQLVPYMLEARKTLHLQLSDSGLGYTVGPGSNGIRPRPGDSVVLSIGAVAADGKTQLPQLSSNRIRVKMVDMLPGFREGLQMMTVGSQGLFVMPPALSFGRGQWPEGVQPGSPLIFQVGLMDVIPAAPRPQN